jgi:hypothetical protein
MPAVRFLALVIRSSIQHPPFMLWSGELGYHMERMIAKVK